MTEHAADHAAPPPPAKTWDDALAKGKLLLQRDPATQRHFFPPRLVSPDGGALEWVEAAGEGTVYAVTVVRPRPPEVPYNVALIDLDEGARMMGNVRVSDPGEVRIGMRVRAVVEDVAGQPGIGFHPV